MLSQKRNYCIFLFQPLTSNPTKKLFNQYFLFRLGYHHAKFLIKFFFFHLQLVNCKSKNNSVFSFPTFAWDSKGLATYFEVCAI